MGFQVELTDDDIYQAMASIYSFKLTRVSLIRSVLLEFSLERNHIFDSINIHDLLKYPTPHLAEMIKTFVRHIDLIDFDSYTRTTFPVIIFKNTTSKFSLYFGGKV